MIGKQIKKIRLAKKLSGYRLAKNAGITYNTLASLESGKGVQLNVLQKVVTALDCELTVTSKTF